MLTVSRVYRDASRRNLLTAECLCDCGNSAVGVCNSLARGNTTSCGCKRRGSVRHEAKSKRLRRGSGFLSQTHFSRIRKHALHRGISFEISAHDAWRQYVKQRGRCALSGVFVRLCPIFKETEMQTASLNRIDSTRGYTTDNIQWVHKSLNLMKMDLMPAEFVRLCRMVARHHTDTEAGRAERN